MQHRVPGRGIDSSSVLRLRPGGGGRGGISQWSLAVRRSSVLAGGQQDLHQESAGKIETHSQVEPGHSPEPIRGMEGWSWAGQHSSPSPTLDGAAPCSHPRGLPLSAPRRRHWSSYQWQRKGVGWPGRCEEPAFLRWPLGKHTGWAGAPFLGLCLQISWARPGSYRC